uniref:Uncharacterized protein n=1 Tax=Aegilops tauschii subsp. strangulata TaxID=200361 RepID=A0A453I2F4_AEGTS
MSVKVALHLNTQHNIGRFLKKYNVFAQIVLLAFYNFYVRVRYTISPSHISPELISIGDQVRVKNRLLPSLSTTLGVNRTTASRCLRVPYPPEL